MTGTHLILDCRSSSPLLGKREHVEGWVRAACCEMDVTILSVTGYDLKNAHGQAPGVSVVALIAESHVNVHTWPQEGLITMDAYSCLGFDAESLFRHFCIWFDVTETLGKHVLERFGIGVEVA